jgi:hypothetical protein
MKRGSLNGIPPRQHDIDFKTVGDLIDYLEILGRNRSLLVDLEGSTWPLSSRHVALWNENDPESPVAFFAPTDWE